MTINIPSLRAAIGQLLKEVEAQHGPDLSLDEDFYWFIQSESLYDPTVLPQDLTLGSLVDDLANIVPPRDIIAHSYIWASAILRYIGDRQLLAPST